MFGYIFQGIWIFKNSWLIGVAFYVIILLFLWILKKRRSFDWKEGSCEILFIVYVISVLKITGIIGMIFYVKDVFQGMFSFNLIPFVGGSLKMISLNFLLFLPYGFLLPVVFKKGKWSWKRVLFIGFLSTMTIEVLQVFGGRYAEIDDIITNAFGALAGYIMFTGIKKVVCKEHRKKGIMQLAVLAGAVIVFVISLSFICISDEPILDGFMALEDEAISEVTAYHAGNTCFVDSYTFGSLAIALTNRSYGVESEVEMINESSETIINDTDYFEIIKFSSPQNIFFENSDKIVMNDVTNIIFNFDNHILYWGSEDDKYTSCVDYMNITSDLKKDAEDQFNYNKENVKELLKESE